MNFGSLFAGIGGFDLGLERAGMKCLWQVEKDPFCQKVLAKHWPNVKRYEDIFDVTKPEAVDLICGGFPCQPFSTAARGRNIKEKDIHQELVRIVGIVRPRLVIAENVSRRAVEIVSAKLEKASGYDSRVYDVPASKIGADHKRRRWWLIAHADDKGEFFSQFNAKMAELLTVQDGVWGAENYAGRFRVFNGVSNRVDRLRALGNAVVPQVVEVIGRIILECEQQANPKIKRTADRDESTTE